MASSSSLPFALDLSCPVDFTDSQKAGLSKDYPLMQEEEDVSQFVIKRYLETLWLPESISPLPALVQSLRTVPQTSLSPSIIPLLKSARGIQNKYHEELLQILVEGAGSGEQEEAMMWFAWGNEKYGAEQQSGETGGDEESERKEKEWRGKWLDRLEKRETQIQILLYLTVLSSPKTSNTIKPPSSPSKSTTSSSPRKTRKHEIIDPDEPTLDDMLEFLMDKLAIWSLVDSFSLVGSQRDKDRDWCQVFCEDIVEPLFRDALPDHCSLLRSKVFPQDSIPDSPDLEPVLLPPTKTRKRSQSRQQSIPPLGARALSREPSFTGSATGRTFSREPSVGDLSMNAPSRSRSQSISAEDRRAARTGVNAGKMQQEVQFRRSLSRSNTNGGLEFGGAGRTVGSNPVISKAKSPPRSLKPLPANAGMPAAASISPKTLVEETPPRVQSKVLYLSPQEKDELDCFKEEYISDEDAMVLAADTPVKSKRRRTK